MATRSLMAVQQGFGLAPAAGERLGEATGGGGITARGVLQHQQGPGRGQAPGTREVTMQDDIVSAGLELMLFGMGTVVVFLTLLVVSTSFMSRIVSRYFAEPQVAEQVPAGRPRSTAKAVDDPQLIAVISAAVRRYRDK